MLAAVHGLLPREAAGLTHERGRQGFMPPFEILRVEPRTRGMSPAILMPQPTAGILKRTLFARNFISQGRCARRNGSMFEQWLLTQTQRSGNCEGTGF